nr:PAS domain S-box protein [Motilibacter aurantiacus]
MGREDGRPPSVARELEQLSGAVSGELRELAGLAAGVCDAPIAVVSLLVDDRVTFPAAHGLRLADACVGDTLCEVVVGTGERLEIEDAAADQRFAELPPVAGRPGVRYYAGVPLRGPDGRPVGALAVQDLRARRRLTDGQWAQLEALGRQAMALLRLTGQSAQGIERSTELAHARGLLDALLAHTAALVAVKDLQGRYLLVNREVARRTGLTQEQILGRRATELGPYAEEWMARDQEVARTGQAVHLLETVRRQDSRPAVYATTKFPLRDEDGEVYAVGAIRVEVDDPEGARARLYESEQRYRALFEQAAVGQAEVSLDGRLLTTNHCLEQMLGYGPGELIGRQIVDLVAPADRARLLADMGGWGTPGYRRQLTPRRYRRKDGSLHPVLISATVVHDAMGRPRAVLATVLDEHEREEAARRLQASEQRQRSLLQGIPDAVVVVDGRGEVREVNTRTELLFGYPAADLVGRPVELLVPGADALGLAGAQGNGADGPVTSAPRDAVARRSDGSALPVEVSLAAVVLDDGPAVIATIRDVTENRALQRQLHASEEQFRQAFADAPTGMVLTGLEEHNRGRIIHVNRTVCTLLGRSAEELIGCDSSAVLHPDDVPASEVVVQDLARGLTAEWNAERRLCHSSGAAVWARLSTSVVHALDARPLYAITQVEDVTARRAAEQRLAYQAMHDALTGLPNRLLLLDHLQSALARSARHGGHVAVLYLDLDNFKDVNDALGHAAGDELLVEFSRRLTACLRDSDTAARLGGDEFVVVCEDLAGPEEASGIASRVEEALDVDVPVRDHPVRVTASIGIAVSSGHETGADLLREADTAMYRAKRAGRGTFALADPEHQARALRQVRLAADLRRALEADDELVLHYQPTFDAGTGAVVALEALIRWQHPEHGLLLPGAFLDVAEDRELMVPLGAWVLRAACVQGAAWHRRLGAAAPEVWVNVSSRQLGAADLTGCVADVLGSSGLPAGKLCLEITERQVVEIDEVVRRDLDGLVALGCRLALDDFGTGHNDMSHLRALPFDTLKIDRVYVTGLGTDRTDTAITTSMVTLAKALGLTVVAEGVERDEQADQLRRLGCDLLQGFLLHRPAPAPQVDRVLALDPGRRPAAR